MSETELKLCPFCMGSAEWEYTPWNEDTETGDDGSGKIECNGCHAVMQAGSMDEAEAKWNTRASRAAAQKGGAPRTKDRQIVTPHNLVSKGSSSNTCI